MYGGSNRPDKSCRNQKTIQKFCQFLMNDKCLDRISKLVIHCKSYFENGNIFSLFLLLGVQFQIQNLQTWGPNWFFVYMNANI